MEQDKRQPTTPSEISELIREAQRQWHETSVTVHHSKLHAHDCFRYSCVPLATPVDWPEELYLSHSVSREAPIPRGPTTMYRGRLWTTRIF